MEPCSNVVVREQEAEKAEKDQIIKQLLQDLISYLNANKYIAKKHEVNGAMKYTFAPCVKVISTLLSLSLTQPIEISLHPFNNFNPHIAQSTIKTSCHPVSCCYLVFLFPLDACFSNLQIFVGYRMRGKKTKVKVKKGGGEA